MNIRRKSQINDFEPLDGDDVEVNAWHQTSKSTSREKNAEGCPTEGSTSDHYRAIKKSHSAKAIAKAKKFVKKKSRYSSLDGSFPTAIINNDNEQKSTSIDRARFTSESESDLSNEDQDETKDEFYFEANFEEVEAAYTDHYFEAIFEDDCEDDDIPPGTSFERSPEEISEQNDTTANLPTDTDINKDDSRPCTPSTIASSSSASSESRPSTPGASVAPSTSAEDSSIHANMSKATKKTFLGKKKTSYHKLDCSSSVDIQGELDLRLKAIHKLKDVTIEQSKKIKKIQLANKANKIRLVLSRKEIAYLRLQNADLKERVTKLEDDLKMAKDDAVVSEEEANRMCTALVLIREEIDGVECRVVTLDDDFEVEDLFAGGEGGEAPDFSGVLPGVEDKCEGSDPFTSEDNDIEFDAFGLYEKDQKQENKREVDAGNEEEDKVVPINQGAGLAPKVIIE